MSGLMQCHNLTSKDTVFCKFVELCEMCCRIACLMLYNQMLKATFCSTQNTGWDLSLAHLEGGGW